jgi:mRNA interferase MazF
MEVVISRFQVWLVELDPTKGHEIRKTRPCLVISPDEMNRHLQTVIAAPMTTKGRPYPSRVHLRFQGKEGQIALDQLRTVDRVRMVKKLGTIETAIQNKVLHVLAEMFAL